MQRFSQKNAQNINRKGYLMEEVIIWSVYLCVTAHLCTWSSPYPEHLSLLLPTLAPLVTPQFKFQFLWEAFPDHSTSAWIHLHPFPVYLCNIVHFSFFVLLIIFNYLLSAFNFLNISSRKELCSSPQHAVQCLAQNGRSINIDLWSMR